MTHRHAAQAAQTSRANHAAQAAQTSRANHAAQAAQAPQAARHVTSVATARAFVAACLALVMFALCACGFSTTTTTSSTSGNGTFEIPAVVQTTFSLDTAASGHDCAIDTSHVADGYVTVSATSSAKLKFQMLNGAVSYNYDLPNDGTVSCYTLNMGNGAYTFRVMQNIGESNYIELFSTSANVTLSSEFAPFLCPGPYCNFTTDSACVAKARELAKSADTQAQAIDSIYQWIISNVTYDKEKAAQLKSVTGYYPDPDDTLATKKGICLDYACLMASMLRSIGVPTKIVTGYVSSDSIYHAWNLVYIDGQWITASFTVEADTWSRVDSTFAASGTSQYTGDGESYVDRFIY